MYAYIPALVKMSVECFIFFFVKLLVSIMYIPSVNIYPNKTWFERRNLRQIYLFFPLSCCSVWVCSVISVGTNDAALGSSPRSLNSPWMIEPHGLWGCENSTEILCCTKLELFIYLPLAWTACELLPAWWGRQGWMCSRIFIPRRFRCTIGLQFTAALLPS